MSVGTRLSFGTLGRLVAAGAGAFAANAIGDPNLGAALAAALAGYLTNRAVNVEADFEQELRASKNHHLQLALAGAFRIALAELADTAHKPLFDSWDAILDAALDQPTTLLAVLIPAEFDPLLDAANPYMDATAAFEEAEALLRFWLAYQQAFERTKAYPAVPPSALPELPPDLHASLQKRLLPKFQKAFADLLLKNDSDYARRAFECRHLHEILADTGTLVRLPLAPLRPPDSFDETRELEILRAENRAIPVIGRESDITGLHAWLASAAPISCRILTGPVGAGKTRLAIQLLEEIGSSSRWHAGFLRDFNLADLNQRRWDRPTLAIVDYAAAAAQPLKTWLAHLADQSPAHPLRVLLLEREANPESGWLRVLFDNTSTGHRIQSLFDPPSPQRVTPLADVELRRQVLSETLKKIGAKPELPAPGTDALFESRLAEPRWEDPLYLMMAALVALQGGLPQALSVTRTDLASNLAERELDRIRKFLPHGAQPESADLLTHLAGIVTACRSINLEDLRHIAIEESATLGFQFPGGPRAAADRVAEALSRQGRPAPIEPDIIGEAALIRCFGGNNLCEGTRTLVRAARRAGHIYAKNVCFAITRTCQDFASDERQDPLDWVEEFIRTGEVEDLDLLLELERQMPLDSLVLRERAASLDQLLLTRFRNFQETAPSEHIQIACARLANNLSVHLTGLGRREEAQALAEESVRIVRQLAQQTPEVFLPYLAGSLTNLGRTLSGVGRREEAVAQGEESIRIYRQLVQQRHVAYLPHLATSLNNLAATFSYLGRREEALAQAEESVSIHRQLAQHRPDVFLPNLAMSLTNLANSLRDLGRLEGALLQAEESVSIYRQLAQQRPDSFLPNLALSVNNLANSLSDLGRREEALAQAEEAVRIHRQLVQQRSDAFLPDLALSVNNLATRLSDVGRREDALTQAEEAVRIRRQLAQQRPDAFLPDLALSLNGVANRLRDLGRLEEALARAEESFRIYQQLAQQRPDAFLPVLAISLTNLANRLSDLGRTEEALAHAEEAVRLNGQLAQQCPEAFLPHLASSLNNLANRLGDLGRTEEALARAEEAVRIRRKLAEERPHAFLPFLATSLHNLANSLRAVGRHEEALAQAQGAVRIYERLAQQRPDAFLPDLAGSLNNLGTMLGGLGRREESLVQAEQSLRIYRRVAQQYPDAFLPDLAGSLNNLAESLRVLGRREEALSHAEEAVRIYRRLAQQLPDAFLPDLARSLAVLSTVIVEDSPSHAVNTLAEAIGLITPLFSLLPQAHAPLMRNLSDLYLKATKAAGVVLDTALIDPVVEIFKSLKSPDPDEA